MLDWQWLERASYMFLRGLHSLSNTDYVAGAEQQRRSLFDGTKWPRTKNVLNGIRDTVFKGLLNRPYFPDIGVIALVPDVWGEAWQVRQQVLTRLAGYFNVVWVNPAQGWRELLLKRAHDDKSRDSEVAPLPGFEVYRHGRWLPKLYRPQFLASFTARQRLLQAQRILLKRGCRKIILYLWRPEFEPALDVTDHDISCYHIDDEYTFSDVEKPIEEIEAKLISRVDQVFIHSPGLLKKKGHLNPNTAFVPNGVDYFTYATPCDEPADIKRIPRPRVGYTGVLKKQLNWDLLIHLSVQHPEWSFVFVGPMSSHDEIASAIEKLSSQGNVHFLGAKSVQDLSAYPQHFDVCIMPYRKDDYTKYIYPLKLHEYLASGRPIVGTRILSLQDFADVIALVDTLEEWSTAITEALTPGAISSTQVKIRRNIAREHDWDKLVKRIAHTLCKRLGSPYLEYFEELQR